MSRKLLGPALLIALVAIGAGCDDETTPGDAGGEGGAGGSGGSGGSGIPCDPACEAPRVCDETSGTCRCECSLGGDAACGAGFTCDTTTCQCVEQTGAIGDPCADQDECAAAGRTPACLLPGTFGIDWVDGYCTVACDPQNNPCPAGAACTGLGCLEICEGDADCGRADYSCVPIENETDQCGNPREDATRVCFPTPRSGCTAANTGGACTTDADCDFGVCDGGTCACSPLGGACITSDDCLENGFCTGVDRDDPDVGGEGGVKPGYCLTLGECDPTQPFVGCGDHGRCEDADGTARTGACIPLSACDIDPASAPACTTDDDCAEGVCEGGRCACSPVGGRCDEFADCVEGGECFTQDAFPDGYCVIWDCDPDSDTACPVGSSCIGITSEPDPHTYGLARTVFACLDDCAHLAGNDPDGVGTCRQGYTCNPGTLLGGIGDECQTNADCDPNGPEGRAVSCNQGVCSLACRAATQDADCPAGWSCFFDSPLRPGICLATCESDAGCDQAAGERCADIGFQPQWGMPLAECSSDQDCGSLVAGATCSKLTLNETCTAPGDCPNGFGCESGVCTAPTGTCTPWCDSDDDCPISTGATDTRRAQCHNGQCQFFVCLGNDPVGGFCFPGCSGDGDCTAACAADDDCAVGYTCLAGTCQRDCACAITAEDAALGITTKCAPSEDCNPTGQVCQVTCAADADCSLGSSCVNGFCGPQVAFCNEANGACTPQCVADAQCGAGQACDTATGECFQACASAADCASGACNVDLGRCVAPCDVAGCTGGERCDPVDRACYASCAGAGGRACPADRICDDASGICELRCDAAGAPACGGGEVCDPATGLCAARCVAGGCGDRVCDEASGVCVECLSAADCTAPQLCSDNVCINPCDDVTNPCATGVCDAASGRCVECVGDGDCAEGVCNPATNGCVECVSDATCAPGVCDPATNGCVGCLDDGDCLGDQVCDTARNQCVGCVTDADCVGTDRCLVATSTCVGCLDAADCEAGEVCDPADNTCQGCVDAADCAEPTPACVGRTCVACDDDADCADTALTPACSANDCVECTAANATACAADEVCDTNTQRCVDCLVDAECEGGFVCNPATQACVQCLTTADCTGTDFCDPATNTCTFDCDPANNDGVTSINLTDCAAGQTCCPGGASQNQCELVGTCPP